MEGALPTPGDQSVFVTDVASGETTRVAPRDPERPVLQQATDFSHDGKMIGYQRVVKSAAGEWNQIFITALAE